MIGVGIDLVEMKKMEILLKKKEFLRRCFSQEEIQEYVKYQKVSFLAGRYAAKEAVVKALGTGLIEGLAMTDIEITRPKFGAPHVALNNMALTIAKELGIQRWLLSISHTENYSIAIAIGQ